jgi:hypothetical protein
MNYRILFLFSGGMRLPALVFALSLGSIFVSGPGLASERAERQTTKVHYPFHPGEKLTYNISWSNVFSAGTAVMEVKKEKADDGGDVLRFVSTARTIGLVDSFYPVRDTVQSVFDPRTMMSRSYSLNQSHGKRKKKRELVFDHGNRKVTFTEDGKQETLDVPGNVQDALSSLYYVRTLEEFTTGKPIVVTVHDSGKTWTVEVHVLGREKIKTPVGEFNTIKIRTYPKYEGVFLNKGEIFIWLTDDSRKVPVLMKSTITIGSIVSMLTDMKLGDDMQ